MATRYYFPFSTGAPSAPVTSYPVAPAWDLTGSGFGRGYLTTTKLNTPLTAEAASNFQETGTTVGNLVHEQYVSDPLDGDQTISGTFTLVLRCGEGTVGGTAASADMSLQCVIRVIGPDGTVRGTLYNGHTSNLTQTVGQVGQEMNTSTQVRLMNSVALTSVSALSRDRIVVEIGHRHHNTLGDAAYQSFLHLGDSTAVADHPLATTTEAKPGWIELSSNVVHGNFGTGSISATDPSDSITSSGQKSAKGTASTSGLAIFAKNTSKIAKGIASLTETASASSTGRKVARGTASVSGTASSTSEGGRDNVAGSGTMSGTASATCSGKKVAKGSGDIATAESLVSLGGVPYPTRYYFPFGVNAPAAPRSDIAPAAGWDSVGAGFGRGHLVTRKRGTTLAAESTTQFMETLTTVGNMAHQQYISDPLAYDQTIQGKFTLVLRGGEASTGGVNSNADNSLQCIVRVIKPDGTERGVLYGGHTANLSQAAGAVGQEFSTSTAVRLMNGVPISPVVAFEDDRIVVEVGHRHHNITNIPYGAYLHLGDSAVADHPLSTTSAAAPGWFEFSSPVGHKIVGGDITLPATENIQVSGKKVAKRSPELEATATLGATGGRSAASRILEIPFDGVDGATPGTSGTGLSTVTVPATSTIAYESTGSWAGEHVQVRTSGTATAPQMVGTISPGRSTLFARFYMRITGLPTSDVQVFRMRGVGSAQRLTLRILTDGKLQLHNGVSAVSTSSLPILTNQWVMILAAYKTTTMEVKLYNNPVAASPTFTISGAATSDSIESVMFGVMNSIANFGVDFDEASFDYQAYPKILSRVGGEGSISSLAIFAKSGFKRAVSAGWAVTGILNPLTGSGDNSNVVIHAGTGSITGASTLPVARSGEKVAKGFANQTATSSLASTGKKVAKRAVTLSATHTLTSAGKKVARGSVTLAGVGALISAALRKRALGSGAMSGTSTQIATGRKIAKSTGLTISAATTAFGSAGRKKSVTVTGTVTTASVLVAGVGKKRAERAVTLPATGSITATGFKRAIAYADLTSPHTITSIGSRNTNYFSGTGSMSGAVSAASTGKKVAKVTGTLSGLVIFAKSTKKVAKGFVSLSAVTTGPTETIGSRKVAIGNPTLSTSGVMTSSGKKRAEAGIAFTNGSGILLAGVGKKTVTVASGSLSASSSRVSTGKRVAKGTGFNAGFVTVTSTGAARQRSVGIGALSAFGLLTASPGFKRLLAGGDLVLAHVAVLASIGDKTGKGTGRNPVTATLAPVGRKVARGTTAASAVSAVASTGRKVVKGSASLTAVGDLEAILGDLRHIGSGVISDTISLSSEGDFRTPRTSIRVGGNYGARLVGVGSGAGRAIPVGVSLED